MNGVVLYQYGTAIALLGAWLCLTAHQVRLKRWRGLWFLLTAPFFFVAWYVLEFCVLVHGCVRLSGAGC
jgi:hypothetical protein